MYKFELEHSIFVRIQRMYLRTWGSLKSTNHKKDWVRKSKIRKESHL
jgi:hypothetical protein